MKRIIILGAGGFGRQACWLASRIGDLHVVAVLDETVPDGTFLDPCIPIHPSLDRFADLEEKERPALLSAVGSISVRQRWVETFSDRFDFTSVIDPTVIIEADTTIGSGVMVLPDAICSSQVEIGDHVILGFRTILSHEVKVGAFTHIASGAILNGRASIGARCSIGAGAIILPNVTIGDGVTIGAGAIVARDVADNKTVIGSIARPPMTPKPQNMRHGLGPLDQQLEPE